MCLQKKKYDVFVSYRRDGGYETALPIVEKLRSAGYRVFFDLESLNSGKFNEQLLGVINDCKDFVLVLPANGLDRCVDKNDWVRREVTCAIAGNKNIIPVMLKGFEWPATLPEDMKDLPNYQGISATSPEYFDLAVERLKGYLKSERQRPYIRVLLWVVSIICLIAVAALSFIYYPVDTHDCPISEYDDDILVSLPDNFKQNITDDVDDLLVPEVLFAYVDSSNVEISTLLFLEDLEDYSPEDLGITDSDQLDAVIENIKTASDKEFDEIYVRGFAIQAPSFRQTGDIRRVLNSGFNWSIYHFENETLEQYSAVCRITPIQNMIFTMKMEKGCWLQQKRNSRVFDSILLKLSPKVFQYLKDNM